MLLCSHISALKLVWHDRFTRLRKTSDVVKRKKEDSVFTVSSGSRWPPVEAEAGNMSVKHTASWESNSNKQNRERTRRNPDVGKYPELLRPPCQQHSLIGWLQDDGHAHIHPSLLDVQWDRCCLRDWQVFDGTEGGSLGEKQKQETFWAPACVSNQNLKVKNTLLIQRLSSQTFIRQSSYSFHLEKPTNQRTPAAPPSIYMNEGQWAKIQTCLIHVLTAHSKASRDMRYEHITQCGL